MEFILQLATAQFNHICLVVKYMAYGTILLLCFSDFPQGWRVLDSGPLT